MPPPSGDRRQLPLLPTGQGKRMSVLQHVNAMQELHRRGDVAENNKLRPNGVVSDPNAVVVAIGDLEGRVHLLYNLLKNLGIIDHPDPTKDELVWRGAPNLYVVQLGDQIDQTRHDSRLAAKDKIVDERHPHVDLQMLLFTDYLQALSGQHFISIIGNHEILNAFSTKYVSHANAKIVTDTERTRTLFAEKGFLRHLVCRRNLATRINNAFFSHAGLTKRLWKAWLDDEKPRDTERNIDRFILDVNPLVNKKEAWKKPSSIDMAQYIMGDMSDELENEYAELPFTHKVMGPEMDPQADSYSLLWSRHHKLSDDNGSTFYGWLAPVDSTMTSFRPTYGARKYVKVDIGTVDKPATQFVTQADNESNERQEKVRLFTDEARRDVNIMVIGHNTRDHASVLKVPNNEEPLTLTNGVVSSYALERGGTEYLVSTDNLLRPKVYCDTGLCDKIEYAVLEAKGTNEFVQLHIGVFSCASAKCDLFKVDVSTFRQEYLLLEAVPPKDEDAE